MPKQVLIAVWHYKYNTWKMSDWNSSRVDKQNNRIKRKRNRRRTKQVSNTRVESQTITTIELLNNIYIFLKWRQLRIPKKFISMRGWVCEWMSVYATSFESTFSIVIVNIMRWVNNFHQMPENGAKQNTTKRQLTELKWDDNNGSDSIKIIQTNRKKITFNVKQRTNKKNWRGANHSNQFQMQ